jgi:hypothetical protein
MFPDAFIANMDLHAGLAKADKFLVLIFQPPGLNAGGLFGGLLGRTKATQFLQTGLNTAGLQFQCNEAVLPGYNINTVEQRVYGAPWTVAGTPVYNDLTLSFICTNDLWERKFFEDWMEFILPKGSQRSTAYTAVEKLINVDGVSSSQGSSKYADDYKSTIQVVKMHETGVPTARYTFEEVYPVSMPEQALSWGAGAGGGQGSEMNLQVTFKYTRWSREKNIIGQIYDAFTTKK